MQNINLRKEKGITLMSLVMSLIIMGILVTLLINAGNSKELRERKNQIEKNLNTVQKQNDEKMNALEKQWDGVINIV